MMEDCLGNVSDGMANEYYGYHDTPSMTHEERKERQATGKMAAEVYGVRQREGRSYRNDTEYVAAVGMRSVLNQIKGANMSKKVVFNTEGFDLEHLQMMRNLLNDAIFQVEEEAKKPKEPEGDDGTIISFSKRFNGRQVYYYAAIKARGGWSVTGQSGLNGIGWERLLNFIQDKESVPARALESLEIVHIV